LALDIPADDALWAVLREELIPAPILHEFVCRCAEAALALVDDPDPRSAAAIAAKRAWLRGEISNEGLKAAREASREAAREAEEAHIAAAEADKVALRKAQAAFAALEAAYIAANVKCATYAVEVAAHAKCKSVAERATIRKKQVEALIEMLQEYEI
jgi:hypothetical protein